MKLRSKTINPMNGQRGFSLVELVVVLAIILVVSAVAVPNIVSAMRGVRLRGTASDYAGLLQQARMRAVQDNRIYMVKMPGLDGATTVAYIDIYPQNADGTSGQNAYWGNPPFRDPEIIPGTGITMQPTAAAPKVTCGTPGCLQNQVVPLGSPVILYDASQTNLSPPSFNSRGLPCLPSAALQPATCGTLVAGPGGGTAVAYAAFFVSQPSPNVAPEWVAVTITPAGRIQTWTYDGNQWGRL